MWAFADFVVRVFCVGVFVLVGWFFYQLTREPSARNNFGYNSFPVHGCLICGEILSALDMVTCDKCLDPSLPNVCEICAGGRFYPNSSYWCDDLQGHAKAAGGK